MLVSYNLCRKHLYPQLSFCKIQCRKQQVKSNNAPVGTLEGLTGLTARPAVAPAA